MSHRPAKISHVVREVVSDAIANRIWDPRVSQFTSVTRVEVSDDLRIASVYVSVMGAENKAITTMKGLESARGMIQSRVARRLDIRQCPMLRFHLDTGLKTAIETIRLMDELRAAGSPDPAASDGSAGQVPPDSEAGAGDRPQCSDTQESTGGEPG